MDEIGFLRGYIQSAKVITRAESRAIHIQPGNRGWTTVIECVSARGNRLPPIVILKGKVQQSTWFTTPGLPPDWVIATSDTGWTNDDLAYI